jgi:hypothetical protein
LYPDGLRQIFEIFSRKIQDFLKENLEFSKSDKSSELGIGNYRQICITGNTVKK